MSRKSHRVMQIGDSPNLDAFGRHRVANPKTIFETQQQYNLQPLLWESAVSSTTATATHLPNESASKLSVASGENIVRQTYEYFRYQPGKSQLIKMTGSFGAAPTGVTKRIGYYDDNNGFFFEQTSSGVGIVKRSKVTGAVVNTRVEQASWNNDSYSGADWLMSQQFIIDLEWLGVGRIRLGVRRNGVDCILHEFNEENVNISSYITSANLPLRYACISSTGGSTSADMRQICTTVISEGGQEDGLGYPNCANTVQAGVTVTSTAEVHLVSFRPLLTFNSIENRATFRPVNVAVMSKSNDVRVRTVYNSALSTGSTAATHWSSVNGTNSAAERAAGSTVTFTGGHGMTAFWVPSGQGQSFGVETQHIISKLPIALDKAGVAQRGFSVVAQVPAGVSATVHAAVNWHEVW